MGVCVADESVESKVQASENKHLELKFAENTHLPIAPLSGESIHDDFLLSHKIAQNQVIGVNYKEQNLNDQLFGEQKSKLWLTLQLAF